MTTIPESKFIIREDGEFVMRSDEDYFAGKRVILFSLPGAFTPTCTTKQLPAFDEAYPEFANLGYNYVYCVSVNDSFVMNSWKEALGITYVEMIPDGNAYFTEMMGQLVDKSNLGFGKRSWRYAAVIDDGEIVKLWEEPGKCDNAEEDPYTTTDPETVLKYLRELNVES